MVGKKKAKDKQKFFLKSCAWGKKRMEGVSLLFGKFSAMSVDDKDHGRMTLSVASVSSNERMLFKIHRAQLIHRGEGKIGEASQPPNTYLPAMCLLKNCC